MNRTDQSLHGDEKLCSNRSFEEITELDADFDKDFDANSKRPKTKTPEEEKTYVYRMYHKFF